MVSTTIEKQKRAIFYGMGIAILVLVFGYGVMSVMYHYWLNTSAHLYPKLKGLYDYKASAWGDPICLPLMIGSGTTYVFYFYDFVIVKYKKLISIGSGVLGGVVGVAMQAQWLISDTTSLNWSIPEQHYFNYAGWYHAFFFVVVFAVVTYLFVSVMMIDFTVISQKIKNHSFSKKDFWIYFLCQSLFWFSNVLFLHFNFLDDYSDQFGDWEVIIRSSLFWLLVLLGLKLFAFRNIKPLKYYAPVVLSVTISTLISYFLIQPHISSYFPFLVAISLNGLLYVYNVYDTKKMLFLGLSCFVIEAVCVVEIENAYANGQLMAYFLLMSAFVLLPALISLLDYYKFESKALFNRGYYIKTLICAVCANVLLLYIMQIENLLSLLEIIWNQEHFPQFGYVVEKIQNRYSVLGIVINIFVYHYIVSTFQLVKKMEYGDERSSNLLDLLKLRQYSVYALLCFSLLIPFCLSLGYTFHMSAIDINGTMLGICVLTVFVLGILNFSLRNKNLSVVLLQLSYLSVSIYLLFGNLNGTFFELVQASFSDLINTSKFVFVSALSVVIFFFLRKSFCYNVALLRQKSVDFNVFASSIIIGLCSALCFYLAAFYVLLYVNLFYVYQLFGVVMISFVLLPYIQTKVLNPDGDVGILDNNKATSSIAQDGFLYGMIVIVNSIISIDILNRLKVGEFDSVSLSFTFSVTLFSSICYYCIKNNKAHSLEKEKYYDFLVKRVDSEQEKEALAIQLDHLKLYLKFQNRLAVIMCLLYSVIFLVSNKTKGVVVKLFCNITT